MRDMESICSFSGDSCHMPEKISHSRFYYEIGDVFPVKNGTLTVVDQIRVQKKDQGYGKKYLLQCEHGHRYFVNEGYIRGQRLKSCKMCAHPPISETDPEFVPWFLDRSVPEEKTRYSHFKTDFYCQHCGKTVRDKSIHTVYQRRQVPCPYCTNGVSYPERYIDALLTQLSISFERQYAVRFRENGRNTFYKYDFYDPEQALVIETHGPQHFLAGVFERMGGQSLEEIQENDRAKKQLANEKLGLRYLDLDCRKSDPDWIRREAVKKLTMYPLECVDWEKLRQDANRALILELIRLRVQGYTLTQIGAAVHMDPSTVCGKLKKAQRDGLFDGITPRMRTAGQKKKEAKVSKAVVPPDPLERIKIRFCVLDHYVNTRTALRFKCPVCGQIFKRIPQTMLREPVCPYCKKLNELKEKTRERFGDEYEITGNYVDCSTPLHIRHKSCGREFEKNAADFFRRGCSYCAARNRTARITRTRHDRGVEAFYKLLPEIEARGYRFVGESCEGLSKRNEFLCSHCGEIWRTAASQILHGRNHICTSPCKKKTHREFLSQISEIAGEEYSVLTEYQDAFTNVTMRHNLCGFVFQMKPVRFTSRGERCPVCTRNRTGSEQETALLQENYEYKQEIRRKSEREQKIRYHDLLWYEKLKDAEEYHRMYGNIDIPSGFMKNGYNLGGWIGEQRRAYRNGELSGDKIEALNHFDMKWKLKEEKWFMMYEKVKCYLQLHDGVNLSGSRSREERKLFYWVDDQTELYRLGKLTQEKAAFLEVIGVRQENKLDLRFNAMCEKLEKFKELHGHCIVPIEEGEGEPMPLGLWAQRMRLQLAAGEMTGERAECLRKLGLPENNKAAKFQYRLALASAYREEHGHLRIPQKYERDGCKLGKWINSLRSRYKNGGLAKEYVKALEEIGMVWETK